MAIEENALELIVEERVGEIPTIEDIRRFRIENDWLSRTEEELTNLFISNFGEKTKGIEGGPFQTKSNGWLRVLYSVELTKACNLCALNELLGIPISLNAFFNYDKEEINRLSEDIRDFIKGLRLYIVDSVPKGKTGGKEYHRIRHEIFFPNVEMKIECEDLNGKSRVHRLKKNDCLYIPPYMMHTYTMLEQGSFLVLANTQFNKNDGRTHDTYLMEEFREMQRARHKDYFR